MQRHSMITSFGVALALASLGAILGLFFALRAEGSPPIQKEVPHPIEGRENCLVCHGLDRAVPFPESHDGRSVESCLGCHKPSATEPGATPAIMPTSPTLTPTSPPLSVPLSLKEEQDYCLSCHGDPGLSKTFPEGREISLYVNAELKENSAHRYVRCTTCHSSKPHEIDTPLTKLSLAAKCGACHQYEYELHLKSIHGQQLVQGNPDVATCVDCHSPDRTPHSVVRVLEYGAPAYKKNVAETCGSCHSDERLMSRYGIVEKVYESYMRSFHGKAMKLATYEIQQLNKATCTSCHGTHDIMDPHDPTSPLAGMENLARTCEQCHPGAGVEFASGFLGHKEVSPEHMPLVFYTERFFVVLTAFVVALGVVVVGVAATSWALRGWREKE